MVRPSEDSHETEVDDDNGDIASERTTIVDARHPLLFLCQDLVQYVAETNASKCSLLLLNKADLLTRPQRSDSTTVFMTDEGKPAAVNQLI
ncbi:hypothetical protein HPB51_021408 [Rhipicephalus microplus]|uniref:Uncharacterized protein n=1 Tax=Rhipicephalus microplus TaxID=6941 RepID=A0A9J6F8C2_RHIMP|nr:hypothetical protein HPB51_021408 [Rhipicephalus microplus]